MKIKLDENLPHGLAMALRGLGHDAQTVYEAGLSGCEDALIWDAVKRERRFLITQDLDFSNTRKLRPAPTPESCWYAFVNPAGQFVGPHPNYFST
jgi:predicted nuclease of predicted toxin-antitoxin system